MNLKTYFEQTKGFGVLSTSDSQGRVDAAVYSRPHIMEDDCMAFIMNDRLSHANLRSNPHAAYLFRENAPGYQGRRFFLTKLKEEKDSALLKQLRRRTYSDEQPYHGPKFLVYFKIDEELPLVGPGEEG